MDPSARACELFPSLSGKNLASQLMLAIPGLSRMTEDADKLEEAARKAAEKKQRADNRAREALVTRDRRVRGPIKTVQKQRLLACARRQRTRLGLAVLP